MRLPTSALWKASYCHGAGTLIDCGPGRQLSADRGAGDLWVHVVRRLSRQRTVGEKHHRTAGWSGNVDAGVRSDDHAGERAVPDATGPDEGFDYFPVDQQLLTFGRHRGVRNHHLQQTFSPVA